MFQETLCLFIVMLIGHHLKVTTAECVHGSLYPHPEDCGLYYQCSYEKLYEMRCPASLHFSPKEGLCNYADIAKCETISSTPSTVPEATEETTTTEQTTTTEESTTTEQTTTTEESTTTEQTTTTEESTTTEETTTTEQKTDEECSDGCANYLTTEMAKLLSRIEKIEAKGIALELNSLHLETLSNQSNIRSSQIETKLGQIEAKLTELLNLIDDVKSKAIMNIRLVDPQSVALRRGPGYQDTNGWVLTGATNFNQDELLDSIHRRRIEKLVNGRWVGM